MSNTALGVDIGGTNIKFGLVSRSGEIIASEIESTPRSTPELSIAIICDLLTDFLENQDYSFDNLNAIGIGFPGSIEHPGGIVRSAPNLPGWGGVELGKLFRENLGREVRIDNDANLAALAEYKWGNGQGEDPLILFTLGTGVGGGIIVGGKILRGVWGGAAEIGHHTIETNGRICGCNNRGCLEVYVGTKGVATRAWELLERDKGSLLWEMMGGEFDSLDAEMVGMAAKDGDRTALIVADEVVKYLGVGVANIINIFNPACVLFAGGMTEWGDKMLLDPVKKETRKRALKTHYKACRIDFAKGGLWSGVLGAAALAFQPE